MKMTTDEFFVALTDLYNTGNWHATLEDHRIRLTRGEEMHTPLTAVYFHLTGGQAKPCFLVPEMQQCGMDEYDVVRLSHAEDACDTGRRYDRGLRRRLLAALNLPVPTHL